MKKDLHPPRTENKLKLAVFDLDHTLFKGNCSYRFGCYLFRHGIITFTQILRLTLYYIRYKYLNMDPYELQCKTLQLFKGDTLSELLSHVDTFLDEQLLPYIHPVIHQRLIGYKNQGIATAILSNSPHFLVEPIGKRLGVTLAKGVEVDVDDQCNLLSPFESMTGEAKRRVTLEWAEALKISVDSIEAYSDSINDLELLESVGKAIAVNPDRRLLKVAKTFGWECIQ